MPHLLRYASMSMLDPLTDISTTLLMVQTWTHPGNSYSFMIVSFNLIIIIKVIQSIKFEFFNFQKWIFPSTCNSIFRISTYIHRKVENRFWGLLFGFNLVFNKKGNLVWGLFSIHIYKVIYNIYFCSNFRSFINRWYLFVVGSDIEAGAFANIEFNPFCSTEGCIYQITPQELELLDKFVGYPEVQ